MVRRGEFVGISGFSSVDWVVSDIATTYMGGVVVPLPTNILAEDVAAIMNEAEVACLMLSSGELAALAPVIGQCTTVRNVVVFDRWVRHWFAFLERKGSSLAPLGLLNRNHSASSHCGKGRCHVLCGLRQPKMLQAQHYQAFDDSTCL
jgi:acyl-coenzyme A synthetase/AMP-(fatty) acid ligase